ncbi:MAG TPA: ferrochelatase [Ktedonobacterales bacterium]|nr:ferrochelatase [Ktedonobacterales bacterium]
MTDAVVANTGARTGEPYDAILLVSFGGPEDLDDIMPFLENVLRGRNVPRERMLEVAHHYELFGGVSPINQQNRDLIAALRESLDAHGIDLPVYWGNRNWHPLLPDTLRQMARDGKRHALAYITSAYSSYSGCRQYLEDIERAQSEVGRDAPQVSALRKFYNHPDFIRANAERVRAALATIAEPQRSSAVVVFTAHSIPLSMAQNSRYVSQLRETARLVAGELNLPRWELAYQSRSGPPSQPWLEPDIGDTLRVLKSEGVNAVVVAPIGFLSDHVEVLYDLDVEARQLADELGLTMARAQTVGTHPAFVEMIRQLITERIQPGTERRFLGPDGASPDGCGGSDCCGIAGTGPSARK